MRAPPDPSRASTYPLWLLAVQCWLLCSPAPSKGKKGNPGFARGFTQAVCSGAGRRGGGSVLQLVRYGAAGRGAPGFPSLLVGVRADCTSIRVAAHGAGCHTFACSVSWACSLLWAMHFYSSFSPPKTIPCVNLNKKNKNKCGLRNLSGAQNNLHASRCQTIAERAPLGWILHAESPGSWPLLHDGGGGWLAERCTQRTSAPTPFSPPLQPPCR